MQINAASKVSAPQKSSANKQPASSSAPQAGDSYNSANAIQVMTFNTAGDGCRNTPENEIALSQPFQKVVKGAADAPIIACQETTPTLAKSVQGLAKNGNFQVVWPGGHTWLPGFLASTLGQGNLVLVPKRYKVLGVQAHTYKGRLGLFWNALKGVVFHHQPVNNLLLACQKRGYESIALQDKNTGKKFTVIATHVAFDPKVRALEAPQLTAAIKDAEAKGPVTVMGDFNTASEATNFSHNQNVADFWKQIDTTGVQDVGAKDNTDESGHDIDHVLQKGFNVVGDEVLDGNKLTIPGRTDAKQVSDHYAHEVTLSLN
ncbi:MAG TPA: hypothetical protein V6D47_12115 [Oscillatoriaceae cyanobacterium]